MFGLLEEALERVASRAHVTADCLTDAQTTGLVTVLDPPTLRPQYVARFVSPAFDEALCSCLTNGALLDRLMTRQTDIPLEEFVVRFARSALTQGTVLNAFFINHGDDLRHHTHFDLLRIETYALLCALYVAQIAHRKHLMYYGETNGLPRPCFRP
jgi:hypothetical protein